MSNEKRDTSVTNDQKKNGQTPALPNVAITIHPKTPLTNLNQYDRLSRARKKVNKLIYDANSCDRSLANCTSYCFSFFIMTFCAIPVFPAFKNAIVGGVISEDTFDTRNLLVLIGLCLFAITAIQANKYYQGRNVELNDRQQLALIEIIRDCQLPFIGDPYHLTTADVLKTITNLENQLNMRNALYKAKLFDKKNEAPNKANEAAEANDLILEYLKDPLIHSKGPK